MNIKSIDIALAFVLTVAASASAAQSWEYKSYRKGSTGSNYEKDNFVAGTISLDEKDGQAWFTMQAARLNVCYRGKLPATVTRTAETTQIDVTQPVPGCEAFRYVIRNDGTGGYKETLMGERGWVKSRFDHGLTPVK